MAAVLSVSVHGTKKNPVTAAATVGLGTANIVSITPFSGTQPISGVTIVSEIKMRRDGTQHFYDTYLSPTAVATIITAAG